MYVALNGVAAPSVASAAVGALSNAVTTAAARKTRLKCAEHPDAPGLLALVRRKKVWIHIDLDVVDPRDLGAVVTPVDGGPPLSALEALLARIAEVSDVRGIELCGYDPSKDAGSVLPGALARTVAAAVA